MYRCRVYLVYSKVINSFRVDQIAVVQLVFNCAGVENSRSHHDGRQQVREHLVLFFDRLIEAEPGHVCPVVIVVEVVPVFDSHDRASRIDDKAVAEGSTVCYSSNTTIVAFLIID